MALVAFVVFKRLNALKPLSILTLTRYGPMGASSRLRQLQYLPILRCAGLNLKVQSLFSDDALLSKYQSGHYRGGDLFRIYLNRLAALRQHKEFDIFWVEKEALPWFPLCVETALLRGVPYVLDFDDAIFHNYDLHRSAAVRWFFGKRIDTLMANAVLVVTGNEYLAQRAKNAGAHWVEVVPTVIDLDRYTTSLYRHETHIIEPLCIVWIGSPSTARYLEVISKALQALSKRIPFLLKVIGAHFHIPGVCIESVKWTEETEVEAISAGHIGVMPLIDSPWEQGKCGYKLIQYMACGLPVVASSVGVNSQIVDDGVNGFLASNDDEWELALMQLLTQSQLRKRMGMAGRAKVEDRYCIQKTGPQMAELLIKASKGF